jgi:FkbH-like protein
MSAELFVDLTWLPAAPADFRRRCRDLAQSPDPSGNAVAHLASFALNETQLRKLSEAMAELRARGVSLEPLEPFKLGIVGNATLEPLLPALVGSAARHGIALECVQAHFGQTLSEALAPDSIVNRARPQAVLLALDHRALPWSSTNEPLAFVRALRDGFRTHGGALSIVPTIPPPPETSFGSFERFVPQTMRAATAAFNAALIDDLRDTPDVLLDVAALAETVGLAQWHSPTQWNVAKLAFDQRLIPLYAEHVCRVIAALRGKSRKCLVLDLDNTLWGGTIGDDGIEGITLGQGDATGEAFLEVQRTALALRDRGIVLAVSSKNDDAVARTAFAAHPDMLLRADHIAVFQANWNDKATNIAAIARELSLGIDALVFLDDNPVERNFVREALPQVAVPELPHDPALYSRTLAAAGYFETVAFSAEDRKRAEYYQDNARRVALQSNVGDLDAYLASLEMRISFRPFDEEGRARIAQLINKSNQFNLTTRRYSEAEVAGIEADPEVLSLQVRLVDRFGDNGMIGVVVARPRDAETLEIDTWLMSCRVLGRRVEHAVLREIVLQARARGVSKLIGVYLPTAKNAMVAEHYAKLGFALVARAESGASTWELHTAVELEAAPMAVDRGDAEPLSSHSPVGILA